MDQGVIPVEGIGGRPISFREIELQALATAAAKASRSWHLTFDEGVALLSVDRATYSGMLSGDFSGSVTEETFIGLAAILETHKALLSAFPDSELRGWLRRPNSSLPFDGAAPLDYMISGRSDAIAASARYLRGLASR